MLNTFPEKFPFFLSTTVRILLNWYTRWREFCMKLQNFEYTLGDDGDPTQFRSDVTDESVYV